MSTPWRLGLFYALIFLANGATLPYLPMWLRAQGLGGAAIGAILAAPYLARVVSGPVAAVWADGFQQRRTSLMLLAAAGALAAGWLLVGREAPAIAVSWFVASTALMAMLPLMDVLALRLSQRGGFVYGRPRAGGSAAFIAANLVMGALLTGGSPDLVLLWFMGALGLAVILSRLLPPEPIHEPGVVAEGSRWRGLGALLKDRAFLVAIVSSGLIQGAHGFQYGFSALLWRGQGISEAVIGALWAAGVAAEILFLWFLPRERITPLQLVLAESRRWCAGRSWRSPRPPRCSSRSSCCTPSPSRRHSWAGCAWCSSSVALNRRQPRRRSAPRCRAACSSGWRRSSAARYSTLMRPPAIWR